MKFKYEAFLAEFPFLADAEQRFADKQNGCPHLSACKYVVKRVDTELLERAPHKSTFRGSAGNSGEVDAVYLYDVDGNFLEEVLASTCHETAGNYPAMEEGESVGEAVARHIDNVYFVVKMSARWATYRGEEETWEVVVHKPPKKFTFAEWVEEARRRAASELAARIAEVDAA